MERLIKVCQKKEKLVIGLMSGTSVDGIDAALVRIKGKGEDTKVKLMAFENLPYTAEVRNKIFLLFDEKSSSNKSICHMNFLLGELFAKAALQVADKAGINIKEVDIIGSHGQTIYHQPKTIEDNGYSIKSTLQIGEGDIIAERTGVITVCDFRARDMAADGLGAPLVPYTEYLLYKDKQQNIGLQNIGGIGNITVIPKNSMKEEVYAFDTGPGNMLIDSVISYLTDNKCSYDDQGQMAAKGSVNKEVLSRLLEDPYFKLQPPKTTGREYFGKEYTEKFLKLCETYGVKNEDQVATATALTAKSIADACLNFVKEPLDQLIIGGGGSYNNTLLKMLRCYMPIPVLTQEDLGLSSDAKEAIAFAILANETICGNPGNLPSATGACKAVRLGKICL